jgi:hypothetical protein
MVKPLTVFKQCFFLSPYSKATQKNSLINVDGSCGIIEFNAFEYTGHLPIKFGRVTGFINLKNSGLTTLTGSPEIVEDVFNVSNNRLTSLEGGPKKVRALIAKTNPLTSLDGLPSVTHYYCFSVTRNLPLLRLVNIPKHIDLELEDWFNTQPNWLDDLMKIIEDYRDQKPQKKEILACQQDLINKGFGGNAGW